VVTCERARRRVTLHDGQMARNGRTLTMTHRQYSLHRIFRERATQDRVYAAAVRPSRCCHHVILHI
jgi:hypothetical protein